jgi:succinyl-CoA synthetase alpha subunit
MSILIDKNTRLVVQGITGREGAFHTQQMIDYGTNVVAGVTPGKGGDHDVFGTVPVFDTVKPKRSRRPAPTPASSTCRRASPRTPSIEAADAGIAWWSASPKGLPVRDMVAFQVQAYARTRRRHRG